MYPTAVGGYDGCHAETIAVGLMERRLWHSGGALKGPDSFPTASVCEATAGRPGPKDGQAFLAAERSGPCQTRPESRAKGLHATCRDRLTGPT